MSIMRGRMDSTLRGQRRTGSGWGHGDVTGSGWVRGDVTGSGGDVETSQGVVGDVEMSQGVVGDVETSCSVLNAESALPCKSPVRNSQC